MTSLRRLFARFILVVAFSATLVPAGAVQVDETIDQVFAQGFYLEPGTSITATEAAALVSSARNEGARYHLVVLVETLPGGRT